MALPRIQVHDERVIELSFQRQICQALTRLLANPPAGFVALREEKTSAVWSTWTAKPFLTNAVCELRGAESDPQQELRCTINDKATVEATTAWYKATGAAIDACLPSLPHGSRLVRRAEVPKQADGFEGAVTVWAYDGGFAADRDPADQ